MFVERTTGQELDAFNVEFAWKHGLKTISVCVQRFRFEFPCMATWVVGTHPSGEPGSHSMRVLWGKLVRVGEAP